MVIFCENPPLEAILAHMFRPYIRDIGYYGISFIKCNYRNCIICEIVLNDNFIISRKLEETGNEVNDVVKLLTDISLYYTPGAWL